MLSGLYHAAAKKRGADGPSEDAWKTLPGLARQLAWRRRNAGIWRSSSSRAGLVRSLTSRIEVCTGAGRDAGLGATATTFSGAVRITGGSTGAGAGAGMAAGIGAAAAGVTGLGAAKAPVMRWNRLGERLSAATGRAVIGRAIGSVARTAGRAAGRLTRQSVSSTSGLCGAGAGAGA